MPEPVRTGLFYIAAVPSTVSSSVALVSLARGNVPVVVFNATVSSLIGVVVSPLWISWSLTISGVSMPILPMLANVALLVILPIVLCRVARKWLAGWAKRNGGWIKHVNRIIIPCIVLGSVSNTTADGVWIRYNPTILLAAIAFFAACYAIGSIAARLMTFDVEDRIAFLFCESKKSLAFGVPLAPVVLSGVEDLASR